MPEARGNPQILGQKDRHTYLQAFPTSCRTSEQTGDSLFLFITGISFRSPCASWEVTLSRLPVPDLPGPALPESSLVYFGSRSEADDSFQSHFAPDRSTHRGPMDCSDPLIKDRHVYHQTKPSLSSCRNSKRMGSVLPSLFATRFCRQ